MKNYKAISDKQDELISKLQSMVDSGQDYDKDYHEIRIELQALKQKPLPDNEVKSDSPINFLKHYRSLPDEKECNSCRHSIIFDFEECYKCDEDYSNWANI